MKHVMGNKLGNFSYVVTYENVTNIKPDPEGIIAICKKSGIPPKKAAVFGDKPEDRIAAQKASVRLIVITSGENIDRLTTFFKIQRLVKNNHQNFLS